jgi:regulator of RNase E activity RraA
MQMKVWSEHLVVSHGWIDVGQADIPVEIGGLLVKPGDILHADMNGIVSIPAAVLDDMPSAIDDVLKNEQTFIKSMRENGYDIEAHRRQIEH